MDCSPPGSSVHDIFPGRNTGVGCHFLLQRIFLTQRLDLRLLHLLHWQVGSLPLHHLGSLNLDRPFFPPSITPAPSIEHIVSPLPPPPHPPRLPDSLVLQGSLDYLCINAFFPWKCTGHDDSKNVFPGSFWRWRRASVPLRGSFPWTSYSPLETGKHQSLYLKSSKICPLKPLWMCLCGRWEPWPGL